MQQELLESPGPELGHVLELRKPVFQRDLAWAQGHRELAPGAPDEDPKGQAVPAGISEDLRRIRCPREPPAILGGSRGRAKGRLWMACLHTRKGQTSRRSRTGPADSQQRSVMCKASEHPCFNQNHNLIIFFFFIVVKYT